MAKKSRYCPSPSESRRFRLILEGAETPTSFLAAPRLPMRGWRAFPLLAGRKRRSSPLDSAVFSNREEASELCCLCQLSASRSTHPRLPRRPQTSRGYPVPKGDQFS